MKPAPFDYHAPDTVAEAVGLLAEHGDEAKPLAGGQSLVPLLALRLAHFSHLVDVTRVDGLAGIERTNGQLRVGATTRQRDVELDPAVREGAPLLARATTLVGHSQIRNRGTVGGSLAHADPASEYPAVALALDATFEVVGPAGEREVGAADLFVGTWTTSLAPDELLTAVRFPVADGRTGHAVEEVARRHGDFALAGAAVTLELDGDDRVRRCAIGLFGVHATPRRGSPAEAALVGTTPDADDLRAAGEDALAATEPADDVHASARYRRRVGAHLVSLALGRALEEARGG